jgi:hypothetical protein
VNNANRCLLRMRDLGFQEQRRSWRRNTGSTRRNAAAASAGDTSPDSVIFTLESNLSLFSSASASVDRCSFASDAHDRDSLNSEISLVSTLTHCIVFNRSSHSSF